MTTKNRFRGIPIVESGTKYQTEEGFSAIKNGVKTRRDAEPVVRGQVGGAGRADAEDPALGADARVRGDY